MTLVCFPDVLSCFVRFIQHKCTRVWQPSLWPLANKDGLAQKLGPKTLHTAFHNLLMQVWSSVIGLDRWRRYFTGHLNLWALLWAPDWCYQLHWKLKKHPQFNMIHASPFILINIPFLCPTLKRSIHQIYHPNLGIWHQCLSNCLHQWFQSHPWVLHYLLLTIHIVLKHSMGKQRCLWET